MIALVWRGQLRVKFKILSFRGQSSQWRDGQAQTINWDSKKGGEGSPGNSRFDPAHIHSVFLDAKKQTFQNGKSHNLLKWLARVNSAFMRQNKIYTQKELVRVKVGNAGRDSCNWTTKKKKKDHSNTLLLPLGIKHNKNKSRNCFQSMSVLKSAAT